MNKTPTFTAVYCSHLKEPAGLLSFCLKTSIAAVRKAGGELLAVTKYPVAEVHTNILVDEPKPSQLAYYRQMLTGFKAARTEIVMLCEHDVLYPASHFEMLAERIYSFPDAVHYNCNIWHLCKDGYFRVDPSATFNSTMGGTRDHMIRAYGAKLAEAEASPNQSAAWSEPRAEDWPVMQHHLPDSVLDVRWGANWTGSRKAANDAVIRQELAPWGAVNRFSILFQ
jgi:hypothetical protein